LLFFPRPKAIRAFGCSVAPLGGRNIDLVGRGGEEEDEEGEDYCHVYFFVDASICSCLLEKFLKEIAWFVELINAPMLIFP
jgi:hypothetical protein